MRRTAGALLLAVVTGLGGCASAGTDDERRDTRRPRVRTTTLLSRAVDGGFPNGPSRDAAVSHDQRIARLMAFESEASDVVAGDENGVADVFVVARARPWGRNGTPWRAGRSELGSRGLGGTPANGPSRAPALDGDSHHAPRCLAFVSEASNLVRGDTNGVADAFVRDLRSGRTTRVSVSSNGRQADAPTHDVAIDGACERVAFSSDASLALRATGRPAWRSARTSAGASGVRQVYVHVLGGTGEDQGFRGLTFLASASASGRPGDAPSSEPAFARSGNAVAFSSEAALAGGDRRAGRDVYLREFPRRFRRLADGSGVQSLAFRTRLVSATAEGEAGDGASSDPSVTDDGRYVAYETEATDLLPGDDNEVADVAEADLGGPRVRQLWVSQSAFVGEPGDGPSNDPVVSGAGEFVFFSSEATNLREGPRIKEDQNGERDVFNWNRPTGNVSLESRDSDRGYLDRPAGRPATSSRGNYAPFETANPEADLAMEDEAGDPGAELNQVYLRYMGPK